MEWSQNYPGLPSMVPAIRAFVRAMLDETPGRDDGETIATELATNALRHSGVDGGEITVTVAIAPGYARIAVTDQGVGEWHAEAELPGEDSKSGRGLFIVAEYATKFGHDREPDQQTVWAELTWDVTDS